MSKQIYARAKLCSLPFQKGNVKNPSAYKTINQKQQQREDNGLGESSAHLLTLNVSTSLNLNSLQLSAAFKVLNSAAIQEHCNKN